MSRNYACQQAGKLAFVWRNGLFDTVYCACGTEITITEDIPRINDKYVLIPKHDARSLKKNARR